MGKTASEWAIRSRRVVTPEGVRPATVIVRGERISAVTGYDDEPVDVPIEDVGHKYLLPGLIDTHVHINEPGRTEWEGFATATRAAAAGGITTVIDMPLNSSPVTTTVVALNEKRAAASGKLMVDCGFHGGVVPGNAAHIKPLMEAGVFAFKAFLCHSGIDEFPNVTEADLRKVMPILAEAGIPLFVHAELVDPLPPEVEAAFAAHPKSYSKFLATRPAKWEVAAIQLMIDLCREYRTRVHIVHLSASLEGRAIIEAAKRQSLPLTIETCPHYLHLAAEDIPDGNARFKCAPPIRDQAHRQYLHYLVRESLIDTIGSDHSPAPPNMKQLDDGNLQQAWGGIASLQLMLPIVWTTFGTENVFSLMTSNAAQLVGLAHRKGSISTGLDADLVVFNPDATTEVAEHTMHHRHKITPYHGHRLRGAVESTYLRGERIFHQGGLAEVCRGQMLVREAT